MHSTGHASKVRAEEETMAMKMTTEEAFIKVLQMHGIEHAFGIIGSAMMPVSDLFRQAGITFWDVADEKNGGYMADGYTRTTGKMAMAIAQNGPGVTGFVTPIKTAYWNHTPMLLVTPQAANKTIGQGGFQEVEQMALFKDMVCYQEEVRDATRIPEVLNRVIMKARRMSAPAQINVPRDLWTQVIDVPLPAIVDFERPAGGTEAIAEAARLLSEAEFPVILNGAGVVLAGAIDASRELAERLDAPVCCNYQHNDAFPGSPPPGLQALLATTAPRQPWNWSPKQMSYSRWAPDSIPFSTLPCYGVDYWPARMPRSSRSISTADRIGLTKPSERRDRSADAKQVAEQILDQALPGSRRQVQEGDDRESLIRDTRSRSGPRRLSESMDHEEDDPGTTWNERARDRDARTRMSASRTAWRAIQARLIPDRMPSFRSDIGNNCAIGNAYPSFRERVGSIWPPGLFGPCGYGFPSIIGAKIGCPGCSCGGICRRRSLRYLHERDVAPSVARTGRPSPW